MLENKEIVRQAGRNAISEKEIDRRNEQQFRQPAILKKRQKEKDTPIQYTF